MFEDPRDGVDVDALSEMELSPGYLLTAKRIQETINAKISDLCGNGNVGQLRGEIAGLRLALAIPGILREEIKASL